MEPDIEDERGNIPIPDKSWIGVNFNRTVAHHGSGTKIVRDAIPQVLDRAIHLAQTDITKAIDLLIAEAESLFSNPMVFDDKWLDLNVKGTWTRRPDGKIDVEGDVTISGLGLEELPYQFGRVSGDFYCSDNQLTSLSGAPKEVGGYFYCSYNQLTSLQGAPKEVGGNFFCSDNQLTSLQGAPKEVGGGFNCYNNQLTSLQGAPKEVGGDFDCSYNYLKSLQGAPKEVGGVFYSENFTDKEYRAFVKETHGKQSK